MLRVQVESGGLVLAQLALPVAPPALDGRVVEERARAGVAQRERLQGAGFRVQGAGCRVQGAGCRVQGAGCRVQGAGCRVKGQYRGSCGLIRTDALHLQTQHQMSTNSECQLPRLYASQLWDRYGIGLGGHWICLNGRVIGMGWV